jgi:Zn-dependent peptidase ImmA (M78 family)
MSIEWKIELGKLKKASEYGEQIAKNCNFLKPPVDPFVIIKNERNRVKAFGDEFGNDFDGRLEYQKPSFLLFYNTKYNRWPHSGNHHPKVLFTVGHELGHYFLEHHRDYLMHGGGAHGSVTEFQSNRLVEREADCFSSGLLMPRYLLGRIVNRQPPTLEHVKQTRELFQVSLTSMLIRWVQLCDFPCAVVSVTEGLIEWGFCSLGLKRVGGYQVRRGAAVSSRQAKAFSQADSSFSSFREGAGYSVASHWIQNERLGFVVEEQYLIVPSTRQMLVFITADEDEV